ncbi:hypothetical protein HJFPF1_05424 [Paramyrothecium foliicola]|nr:hypothetical protein HJFPF1_05424 [Paramyrothecium foliicola]
MVEFTSQIMKTSMNLLATSAGVLLAAMPFAQAGHLCLSQACIHALPDKGESCGSYQMWAPGREVCGAGSYELGTLEEAIGDGIYIEDICGEQVGLAWADGRPELVYVDVEGGMSYNIPAENIEGTDNDVCTYSGFDCWEVAAFFGRWYWPDIPLC